MELRHIRKGFALETSITNANLVLTGDNALELGVDMTAMSFFDIRVVISKTNRVLVDHVEEAVLARHDEIAMVCAKMVDEWIEVAERRLVDMPEPNDLVVFREMDGAVIGILASREVEKDVFACVTTGGDHFKMHRLRISASRPVSLTSPQVRAIRRILSDAGCTVTPSTSQFAGGLGMNIGAR